MAPTDAMAKSSFFPKTLIRKCTQLNPSITRNKCSVLFGSPANLRVIFPWYRTRFVYKNKHISQTTYKTTKRNKGLNISAQAYEKKQFYNCTLAFIPGFCANLNQRLDGIAAYFTTCIESEMIRLSNDVTTTDDNNEPKKELPHAHYI